MNEASQKLYDEMLSGDNYYSFYMGKLPDGEGYGKTDWNCVQKRWNSLNGEEKRNQISHFYLLYDFFSTSAICL